MTDNRQSGSDSSQGAPPRAPNARQRQRQRYRDGKSLARAGTGRSSGGSAPLLIVSAIAVVVGIALIALAYLVTRPAGTGDVQRPVVTTPSDIPSSGTTLGSANAPVTIDVYGDFRCSACEQFTVTSGTESQLVDNYVRTGKAKLVWHNYIVIDHYDGSTASRDAANAALCAADQGKFWTMHDWLYGNQVGENASAFTQERLLRIGQAAGLDMGTFRPCVVDGAHDDQVAAEVKSAPTDISGTPSIFVNGKEVAPGYVPSYSAIAAAIDAALK